MATTQDSVSQPPQQHQVAQGSQGAQIQQQQQQRRLVLVVEGTAGLGPYWPMLRSEYIDKLTRAFCGQDANGQAVTPGEMALVVFCSHGSYSGCLVQYSGWTSSLDVFSQWLSSIDFAGGGFGEVAIAEGLAQALMMCCPQSAPPVTQPIQRHCVLVAASNPHRLQTPVPHPPINISIDTQPDHWWLADADTVAKAFPQCHVSLSIVCPRQLPSLKDIYDAGKRNARAADPAADIPKHAQHLVLLSESFPEARASLRRATPAVTAVTTASTAPLPSTVKVEQQMIPAASTAPATGQTAPMVVGTTTSAVPTASTIATSRQGQAISNATMATPSVKIEHGSVVTTYPMSSSNVAAIPLSMQSSAPTSVSAQDGLRPPPSTDATPGQDFKSIASLQGHRPVGAASILNSVSHIRHNPGVLPLGTGSVPALSVSNMLSAGSSPLTVGQGGLGITQPAPNSVGFGGAPGVGHAVSNTAGGVQANGTPTTNILPSNTSGLTQPIGNANNNLPPMQSMAGLGQGMQPGGSLAPGAQISQTGLGVPHGALSGQGSAVGSTGTAAMMPTPGMSQPVQPVQSSGVSNNTSAASANLASTPVATPPQSTGNNAKYTKLWQGVLAGQRQGKPVPICNLEGYRQTSSPETLAADWPPTMQIVRLIPQDYMNSKEYQGKAELLVFRPLSQHGFLSQLAEKKLCAVIQLPSQTLLLASADKPQRMIGMLFPGDMVVFKPQASSQGPAAGPTFAHQQTGQLQNRPQMMPNSQPLPGTGLQILPNSQSAGFLP